jgi:hypothetical protein
MEAFMRILASVIAVATTLAITLAFPSVGEAQSKKSKARAATTQQQSVPRPKVVAQRSASPCVRRVWWGCVGWDPDPNVRAMLARDIGGDD